MTIESIKVDTQYNVRGDIVDVVCIVPGKTPRQSRVVFILRDKGRPRGVLDVGEQGELGIVNFAAWATPVKSKI